MIPAAALWDQKTEEFEAMKQDEPWRCTLVPFLNFKNMATYAVQDMDDTALCAVVRSCAAGWVLFCWTYTRGHTDRQIYSCSGYERH